jgi:hypothetical protein
LKDNAAPSGASALFRKRLSRRADFLDVLWTLLVIAAGGQAPWEEEDLSPPDPAPGALQLLARATGVDRAMSDDPIGNGSWLPADFDLPKFMAELRDAGGFELEDAAHAIHDASDAELTHARENALIFSRLAMMGSPLEGLLGDDVAGLGALSTMACTHDVRSRRDGSQHADPARTRRLRGVLSDSPTRGTAASSVCSNRAASRRPAPTRGNPPCRRS